MITMYVDMDGVLADFYPVYNDLKKKYNVTEDGYVWKFFSKMVKEESIFTNLPMLPRASYLISSLKELQHRGITETKILTSAGDISGVAHYQEAKQQKEEWLKNHNINWPVIVVKRKEEKAEYAGTNSVLIDDTESNINEFNRAGGNGILYSDETYEEVMMSITKIVVDKQFPRLLF